MWCKLLSLMLMLILCACSNDSKPLLRIGDRAIGLEEFRQELHPLQRELLQLPAAQQKLLLRQALSQLIDQKLLLAEAQKRQISVTETEMQQAMKELRGNYTSEEYLEMLRNSGQDPDHWLQQLRISLLSEKVASSITRGKIDIDTKQIEEYYLQHLDDYRHPEQLQARQMLLQSEIEAVKLRNRVLGGEAFADLAAAHSLSPDREAGGSLGLFARGQLPNEFDQVLFDLPPGRVSEPVKSPYGIHLFIVEKKLKAGVLPLDDVKQEIRRTLQKTREAQLYQQWLQELREQTAILIDWEQLDKIHFAGAE